MKKIAIIQSSYIPWKGFFDIIRQVDEFYIGEYFQYTMRDWRNRNCIKTPHGLQWLTIPVHATRNSTLADVRVAAQTWRHKHWESIQQSYRKARYFEDYAEPFHRLYLEDAEESLTEINYRFMRLICKTLAIKTPLIRLSVFEKSDDKNRGLIRLCQLAKAECYLSGPSAKTYLDETLFASHGIKVEWMDYNGYPEYRQLYPPFEQKVSVIDLIFNEGAGSLRFLEKR